METKNLLGKDLGGILEGFKLKGIATRVQEKHGGLLAYLSLEANVGLNDKFNAVGFELVCEVVPLLPTENSAEVANWNIFSIHLVSFGVGEFIRLDVCRKLVTKEVEVNPLVSAPSNITAQEASIKLAGFFDVTNWKSEVERFKVRHNA